MLSLIISICCTVLLGFGFKEFQKRNYSIFSIILLNYFFCSIIGFILIAFSEQLQFHLDELLISILLGAFFILGFNWYAQSIKSNGLAMTTVIQKMSVVVTVIVALIMGDSLNLYQKIAVLLAIIAIYFLTSGDTKVGKMGNVIFLAAGASSCIEILFIYKNKYAENLNSSGMQFTSSIFFIAFLFGLIFMLTKKETVLLKKEIIISGLALAIPNFASIYFLNHALSQQIPGSIAFPILNCSVILISVLVSILFYGEKFTTKKFAGLLLALLAVFIISKYL